MLPILHDFLHCYILVHTYATDASLFPGWQLGNALPQAAYQRVSTAQSSIGTRRAGCDQVVQHGSYRPLECVTFSDSLITDMETPKSFVPHRYLTPLNKPTLSTNLYYSSHPPVSRSASQESQTSSPPAPPPSFTAPSHSQTLAPLTPTSPRQGQGGRTIRGHWN